VPTLTGIRCVYCNRASTSAVCRGCAKASRPTRLLSWMRLLGVSCAELARRAKVGERTVRRARDGSPVAARVALALHGATGKGVPLEALLAGS
jgi:hypothetical protein